MRKDFLSNHENGYPTWKYEDKIEHAKSVIKDFLELCLNKYGKLPMISFSGGKDSCVLRDLVFQVQKELNHSKKCNLLIAQEIFHPETLKFINKIKCKNDEIVPWIKSFNDVIEDDGYPLISKVLSQKISHIRNTKNPGTYLRACFGLDGKSYNTIPKKYIHFLDKNFVKYNISHKCCDYLKGGVKHDKRPCFIGTTIEESRLRKDSWIKRGCNFESNKKLMSRPLSLLNEEDIWRYIKENRVPISNIYKFDYKTGKQDKSGYKRSGCIACMFGMSLEEEIKKKNPSYRNRFEIMYDENINTFNTFVNDKYQMWLPLTDMYVKLNINDDKYLNNYKKRKQELDDWYKNLNFNLKKIIDEINDRSIKSSGKKILNKEDTKFILKKYGRK